MGDILQEQRENIIKVAIVGGWLPGRREAMPGLTLVSWPAPTDWSHWLQKTTAEHFDFVLFMPPEPFQPTSAQISNFFLNGLKPAKPDGTDSLAYGQDAFERARGAAYNFSALVVDADGLAGLGKEAPANWAQLTLAHAGLPEPQAIGRGGELWQAASVRGNLSRGRLAVFRKLTRPQLLLELGFLGQAFIFVFAAACLAANALGADNMLWLFILLLYPLNRPFIHHMVKETPEQVPAGLGYCLFRPVVWLAGLLIPSSEKPDRL